MEIKKDTKDAAKGNPPPEKAPAAKMGEGGNATKAATAEAASTTAASVKASAESPDNTKLEGKAPTQAAGPEIVPQGRQGGAGTRFAALFLGGVAAAAIGYFAAVYLNPTLQSSEAEISALQAQDKDLSSKVSAIGARLEALEASAPREAVAVDQATLAGLQAKLEEETAALESRVAATQQAVESVMAEINAARESLSQALAEGSSNGESETPGQVARNTEEIATLKAGLDALATKAAEELQAAKDEAAALSETAHTVAARVDLTRTIERLSAAVATGQAYAPILTALAEQTAIDIPEALINGAETGVPALPELQQAFPQAARRALKASIKASADESLGGKLTAFLKSQIGARSLEVREGEDPDAVLSRAEAALQAGDLRGAVDLVQNLPEAGQAEMKDWLAQARQRLDVQDAYQAFLKSLDSGN